MATKLEFNGSLGSYVSGLNYDKPNIWTPEIVTMHADGSIYLRKYQEVFTLVSFEWCFTSTNGAGPGLARVQIFKDRRVDVLDQNNNHPGGGTSGWRKYDFASGFDIDIQIALDASTTEFSSTNGGYEMVFNEHVKLQVRNIMVDLKAA